MYRLPCICAIPCATPHSTAIELSVTGGSVEGVAIVRATTRETVAESLTRLDSPSTLVSRWRLTGTRTHGLYAARVTSGDGCVRSLPFHVLAAGDADADLEVDSDDFVQVFSRGKYETGEAATWAEGDYDGDLDFDSADIVELFSQGLYQAGRYAPWASECDVTEDE